MKSFNLRAERLLSVGRIREASIEEVEVEPK